MSAIGYARRKAGELSAEEWLLIGVAGYFLVKSIPNILGSVASSVGSAAVTIPAQVVGAAAQGVYNAASNPATNPLYDFGSSVGSWWYDLMNPSQPASSTSSDIPANFGVNTTGGWDSTSSTSSGGATGMWGYPDGTVTLRQGKDGVYR